MRFEAVEAGAWKRVRTSRVLCFVWLVLWGISWGWREGGGGGGSCTKRNIVVVVVLVLLVY